MNNNALFFRLYVFDEHWSPTKTKVRFYMYNKKITLSKNRAKLISETFLDVLSSIPFCIFPASL